MSKQIKKFIPNAYIEGNNTPPRSGAFEVTIDDIVVYSKLQTGEFPNKKDISSWF